MPSGRVGCEHADIQLHRRPVGLGTGRHHLLGLGHVGGVRACGPEGAAGRHQGGERQQAGEQSGGEQPDRPALTHRHARTGGAIRFSPH